MYFAVKEGSSAYIHSVPWEELNLCKCFDTESTKILSALFFHFDMKHIHDLAKHLLKYMLLNFSWPKIKFGIFCV